MADTKNHDHDDEAREGVAENKPPVAEARPSGLANPNDSRPDGPDAPEAPDERIEQDPDTLVESDPNVIGTEKATEGDVDKAAKRRK